MSAVMELFAGMPCGELVSSQFAAQACRADRGDESHAVLDCYKNMS